MNRLSRPNRLIVQLITSFLNTVSQVDNPMDYPPRTHEKPKGLDVLLRRGQWKSNLRRDKQLTKQIGRSTQGIRRK